MTPLLSPGLIYGLSIPSICHIRRENNKPHLSDSVSRFLYNLTQTTMLALTLLLIHTLTNLRNKQPVSLPLLVSGMVIPFTLTLTTSGLTYLAKKTNCLSAQMEKVDQHLGKMADILNCISSIMLPILLAQTTTFQGMALFASSVVLVTYNLLEVIDVYKK